MPGERMNIWTVDKATIRAEIRQRNALRKSALLPLLDEQKEFDHACTVIRAQRWHAFRESKQADRQRIRDGDVGRTQSSIGVHWLVGI